MHRYTVRHLTENDLDLILIWRNHPKIRFNMKSQHVISRVEHQNWFAKSSQNPMCKLLIVEQQNKAIGFVSFSNVQLDGVSEWGFYVSPDAVSGSGKKICSCAISYAFENWNIKKIFGSVLAYNEPSKRLHLKLFFKEEGRFRRHICVQEAWYDLFCYGLLREEWPNSL